MLNLISLTILFFFKYLINIYMHRIKADDRHFIDIFVGKTIRNQRKEAGISLKMLADAIGLTQQQVQKYEKGENRISASKLFMVARTFNKEVSFFFPYPYDYIVQKEVNGDKLADSGNSDYSVEQKEDVLRLLKAFNLISNPKVREQIIMLVETLTRDHNLDNNKQIKNS